MPTGKSSPGRHGRQGGPLALTDWPANVTCRLYAPVVWRAEATVIPAIETIGTSPCWPGNSNGPPAATDWAPHFTCGPRAPSLFNAAHNSRAREWGALSCPRPKIAMSARELGWAPSGDGMGLESAQRRIRGRARARSPARSGFCIALIRKVAMVAWKLTHGPCAVAYGGPNLPCGLHAPTFRRDVRRARAPGIAWAQAACQVRNPIDHHSRLISNSNPAFKPFLNCGHCRNFHTRGGAAPFCAGVRAGREGRGRRVFCVETRAPREDQAAASAPRRTFGTLCGKAHHARGARPPRALRGPCPRCVGKRTMREGKIAARAAAGAHSVHKSTPCAKSKTIPRAAALAYPARGNALCAEGQAAVRAAALAHSVHEKALRARGKAAARAAASAAAAWGDA